MADPLNLDLLDDLASFASPVVTKRLSTNPEPIPVPAEESAEGVCLFVDVTGFTPMTERLATRGAAGAEEMASILNTYFGPAVNITVAHGGEIVDFAGDAMLMVFWGNKGDLRPPAVLSMQCAGALHDFVATNPGGEQLSIKVTGAAGKLKVLHVGGVDGRKRSVLVGGAITELRSLDATAEPGQTVVGASIAALLDDAFTTAEAASGAVRITGTPARKIVPPVVPPHLGTEAGAALREYVPEIAWRRLEGGQADWLGEFRRITSVFINLIGVDYTAADPAERLNDVLVPIQKVVHHYGGRVHQLIEADKGTVLLAAFGLPPAAHEDDPSRAVMAALEVENAVADQGLRSAIGITTGGIFFGPVGGLARRDYMVLGDVVNLAARLMQSAVDDILCDATTAEAFDRIEYDLLDPLVLKGLDTPVTPYRPHGDAPRTVRSRAESGPVFGRDSEISLLERSLDDLGSRGQGGVIVLEGEAGIGKSRLIEFLIAKAAEHDFRVFSGAGSAIEDSTPYFGWRSILRDALGLSDVPQNPGAIRRHVLRLFRVESLTMSDAPLLNDVLQLQLPHNPEPGSASDEVRTRHTRALLVDLVEGAKAADPLVIIIDDCQWLDSASWALLGDAVHRLPGTLFVVATRPITAPGPEELSQIKVGARHMLLDGLSAEATLQMVESDLGVNGLPESVETLIIERAGGHPFFSEEIALSLVDVGVITIDGHNAALGADPADLNRIVPPGTVQNVVTSRIDQLDAGAQFVLRIASVIGRTFDADLLTAVYPIADDREEVTRHLLVLEERGLIRREEGASGEVLAFRHAITRDVAYESILYSQRRHLHRAVAAELEASYEDHRGLDPILAHHWERAAGDGTDDGEALHKAEGYLTESGLGALRHGAFIEARDFLKRALAVQERAPEGNDSLRTLEILKHLGTATFATSGYGASETRAIFERAYAMAEGRVSPS